MFDDHWHCICRALANGDRQPLESTSRGPSELLPDDFDSAACSADERDRAKSDKALWRIALKRSALPQQATDNGQLESTIDPTDVSTSVTISTSSSASRDRYLTSNMSPSRLRPSISDRDYATMGNQGGSDTGVISFCKSSRSYRCRVCSQLFTDHDSFSRVWRFLCLSLPLLIFMFSTCKNLVILRNRPQKSNTRAESAEVSIYHILT